MAEQQGRLLSEAEFNTLRERVIANAPKGLNEQQFKNYFNSAFAGALAEAEHSPTVLDGSSADRFAKGVWGSLLGAVTGAVGMGVRGIMDPQGMARDIGQAQVEQGMRAVEAARSGQTGEAVRRGVAAAVPIIGPAGAAIGDYAEQTGDVAGAAGQLVGTSAATAVPLARGPLGKAAVKVGQGGRAMTAGGLRVAAGTAEAIKSPIKTARKLADSINPPAKAPVPGSRLAPRSPGIMDEIAGALEETRTPAPAPVTTVPPEPELVGGGRAPYGVTTGNPGNAADAHLALLERLKLRQGSRGPARASEPPSGQSTPAPEPSGVPPEFAAVEPDAAPAVPAELGPEAVAGPPPAPASARPAVQGTTEARTVELRQNRPDAVAAEMERVNAFRAQEAAKRGEGTPTDALGTPIDMSEAMLLAEELRKRMGLGSEIDLSQSVSKMVNESARRAARRRER